MSSGGLNALNVMFYLKDVAAVSDTLNKGQTDELTHHPVLSHTHLHTHSSTVMNTSSGVALCAHILCLCALI